MISLRGPRTSESDLTIATLEGDVAARVPAAIRMQLQYLFARLDVQEGGVPPVIGVTSALPGEGVSQVSHGLGAVLSLDAGREVCVVGVNWWGTWGDLDELGPGSAGVLEGRADLDDSILATRYPALAVLPAGEMPMLSRVPIGTSSAMGEMLDLLRAEFDHVVVDLPAIASSSVALSVGAAVDATLLVTRQRQTRVDQVERAVDDLRHTSLLGIVLNDNSVSMPDFLRQRLIDN